MNTPIQPPAPVNNIVTIQPVVSTVTNQQSGAAQNPLAGLASGTTVEGFVVNRDAQNNPIVRTSLGDLRMNSEVFLKTGSEVVFKVDTTQASLARIVSVDGMTLQDYDTKNNSVVMTKDTVSTSPLQPTAPQPAAGKAPAAQPMPILQALILHGNPEAIPTTMALRAAMTAPMPLLAQLAQLRAGTPIKLNVLDLKLPPIPVPIGALSDDAKLDSIMPQRPTNAPQAPSAQPPAAGTVATGKLAAPPTPSAPAQAQPVQAPTQPATAAIQPVIEDETAILKTILHSQPALAANRAANESADALLLKSELMAHYAKSAVASNAYYTPPTAREPAAQRPPVNPPQVTIPLEASVIGHEADGANILHTSFATLKLYTTQPLPTGTTLTVQASVEEPATQPVPGQPAVAEDQAFDATTKRNWESLDEVMTWLKQTNPEMAQEVALRLPQVNNKLSSGLLFFITALKNGNVNDLFNKRTTRLLEANAPELIAKLRRDIGQIQLNMIDSPLANWSIAQLPLVFGQEMQHAQLYISKEPPEKDGEQSKNERGQRFILEVGMSQLGPMQLDGFVRNGQGAKSFDLIIRSDRPLDTQVTQGIINIFQNSMEVTGMQGQVVFQTGAQHFFKPAAEPKSSPTAGGANTILA